MLAFLFPGQGSQSKGMGKELFDEFPDLTAKADKILGYSIKQLCLEDSKQQLNQTQYTQPAIYFVNALSFFKKLHSNQSKPDYVAGHSLGEFNALLAAEVFDFETGLNIVKKRGELMSQVQNGGMAAIVGLNENAVKKLLDENHLTTLSIANYNSYLQHVISGTKDEIEQARNVFANMNSASFVPLKVSGSFHSPSMISIQKQFAEFLEPFQFETPTMPVLANVNTEPYHPAVTKLNMANQIAMPVQWLDTIEYLLAQNDMNFEEIGSGNVLTGLLRKIKNKQ